MPQSQDKEKNYHDVAFPLTGDLRKEISKNVLSEYRATEKSVERKNTLGDKLAEGAEKARSAAPRAAAKSRSAGVLE
jgi:hypothetical protein